jgi:hypothetical protein
MARQRVSSLIDRLRGDPGFLILNITERGEASCTLGKLLLYFAWSRPGETGAPLTVIDDRFPAIFELRRLFYPKFEALADPGRVDQGIAGFLDHVQKPNFAAFADQAATQTGRPVKVVERVDDAGTTTLLDEVLVTGVDTIVVISFDSLRTRQSASQIEIEAIERFLKGPNHLIFVCPHHDIGETSEASTEARFARQTAEHLHQGDSSSPPRQGFSPDWASQSKTALDCARRSIQTDLRHRSMSITLWTISVCWTASNTFNLHPHHLPQLERLGDAADRMEVLVRQKIDLSAPPHPFAQGGRESFDALLQSSADTFAGRLMVCDTTLFSSTAGGVDSLRRLWTNIIQRPQRSPT